MTKNKILSDTDSQQSFLVPTNQDDNLLPMDLSGDQGGNHSVLTSATDTKKANFLLTVTTIIKTSIGAGILALPYTVSRLGYVLTLIIYLFMIPAAQLSAIFLLKAKNLSKHSNYSSIMYHIFRRRSMQTLCSSAIFIGNTGICIAELTLFKGALKKIIDNYVSGDIQQAFYTQQSFIVIVIALLQLPLALVKKIEKLKFMAFIGVTGICVFLIAMIINFIIQINKTNLYCSKTAFAIGQNPLEILSVIPNVMLSLCYHQNFFPIFKALDTATDIKMKKASMTGILSCSFCYISVGLMGACLYGKQTQGNFLLNFDPNKINIILYYLMNGGFLISVFFSFPIMFFGARNNFIEIIKILILKASQISRFNSNDPVQEISSYLEHQDNNQSDKRKAYIHFLVYTLCHFGIIVTIGVVVDSIQDVFSVVGAIASNSKAFLFPCLFYFGQIYRKNRERKPLYYLSIGICISFLCLGVIGIISNFIVSEENVQYDIHQI